MKNAILLPIFECKLIINLVAMVWRVKIKILFVFCALIGTFSFCLNGGLTPSEQRGKLIYTKGLRSSGVPIEAQMSGAKFDAKILACVNCHGEHGIGNPEGGVDPSPLEWSVLTKPYSIEFKNGRKRAKYDSNLFKRAIEKGIDPSDNKLDPVMPQYALNENDITDLIAYLKVIGSENPKGITNNRIDIGIILPPLDDADGRSEAVFKVIESYIDLINKGGGIFNRKIQLVELFLDEDVDKSDVLIQEYLTKHELFSLVACDMEYISKHSIKQIEKNGIPVIGALNGNPESGDYFKNEFYYLLPGLLQEIQGLTQFAVDKLKVKDENFVILYDSKNFRNSLDIQNVLSKNYSAYKSIDINSIDISSLIPQLKSKSVEHCLLLSNSADGLSFLRLAEAADWYPSILASSKSDSKEWLNISQEWHSKIFISYPSWSTERNSISISQYQQMASLYNLKTDSKTSQFVGLSSIILFSEVLKMSGKNVNRASFINQLQNQRHFETGFISALSFGPNKRIGSEKIFIAKADLVNSKFILVD